MADSPRIEELKRRVHSDPASIAFAALAEEYRRSGRFEEAITTCRGGLQRHPSYVSAHVTLGRALLEVGDYDDARQELELVLRVAPENLAALRGLAEIHHRLGGTPVTNQASAADTTDISAAAPVALPPDAAPMPPPATPGPIRVQNAPMPIATEPPPAIVVAPPPQLAEDRALAGLEEFLQAILRVRKAASDIHVR